MQCLIAVDMMQPNSSCEDISKQHAAPLMKYVLWVCIKLHSFHCGTFFKKPFKYKRPVPSTRFSASAHVGLYCTQSIKKCKLLFSLNYYDLYNCLNCFK